MPVSPVVPSQAPAPAPAVADPGRTFRAVLEAHLPSGAAAASATSPVRAGLEAVERAQARLEAVLAAARSGRTFTAGELLGLQADAYRAVQVVDLAGKLVEQGAQSVRQALNTPL